jgi:aminopeptidase N
MSENNLLVKGRLSNQVYPISYNLSIKPNFKDNTFEGKVIITIEFKNYELTKFGIHMKDLIIYDGIIKFDDRLVDIEIYTHEELLVIHTFESLKNTQHVLTIYYSGKIRQDLMGFYRASSEIYSTQFEPADARSVFPCFDEARAAQVKQVLYMAGLKR